MRWRPLVLSLALAGAALAAPATARGQDRAIASLQVADSGRVQMLRTRDGSTFIGRVVDVGPDTIRFQTGVGLLTIPRGSIVEARDVPPSAMRGGTYWPPNPNSTRLLFAPTGRMLPAGDGYYSNVLLFFNSVAVGVVDRVTLGAGLSVFPFDDFGENLFFFTPKVGLVQRDAVNIAAGALIGAGGGTEAGEFGIAYGVATFGSTEGSVTLGTGVGYLDGEFADRPIVVLGGERRLSRRIAFVTENYVLPATGGDDNEPVVSYGLRFLAERLAVDLAFVNVVGNRAIFPGIPYVDFVFNF